MRLLDQHFTDADEARQLVASLVARYDPARVRHYLEPSCGVGAFVDALLAAGVPRNQIRSTDVDLNLAADVHGDFLESTRESLGIETFTNIIVVGNPPFGKSGDKARAFIKKATNYGNLIAFVVPRGMQGAHGCGSLNPNLELIWERQVGAFDTTTARCNWQIWALGDEPGYRPEESRLDTKGLYEFVEPGEADLIIRRVGSQAGHIETFDDKGAGNRYFIKVPDTKVFLSFFKLNPQGLADLTTHQLSLSKTALHALLEEQLLELAIHEAKIGTPLQHMTKIMPPEMLARYI